MAYFIKFIILSFCFITLVSCGTSGNQSGSPNNTDTSVDQLRKEVLDAACDEALRKDLEDRINKQYKHLSEAQMIKSLQNMKKDIKCN